MKGHAPYCDGECRLVSSEALQCSNGMPILADTFVPGCIALQTWTLDSTGYAVCKYRRKKHSLHRILAGVAPKQIVDHVNGNKLDNRSQNLRVVDHKGNRRNSVGVHKTSRYKGVHLRDGLWRASIKPVGKTIWLGDFETPEEAARAYDAAACEHYGAHARLNFKTKILS